MAMAHTLVFFILAIVFQGIRGDDLDFSVHPKPKEFCDTDVFISSKPINGKVFLIPGDLRNRKSDWYGNRSFCAQNCADMVTIQSAEENKLFIDFSKVNGQTITWIGGKGVAGKFSWSKPGEPINYTNELAGQFSNGEICAHTYTVDNKWYTQPCNDANIIYSACQRSADWVPCE